MKTPDGSALSRPFLQVSVFTPPGARLCDEASIGAPCEKDSAATFAHMIASMPPPLLPTIDKLPLIQNASVWQLHELPLLLLEGEGFGEPLLGAGIGGLRCEVESIAPTRLTARCNTSAWHGKLRGLPWLASASGHGVGCAQLELARPDGGAADLVVGAPVELLQPAVSDPAHQIEALARRARGELDTLFVAWTERTRTGVDPAEVLSLVPSTVFQLDAFSAHEASAWAVFSAVRRVRSAMMATQQAAPMAQARALCDWAVTVDWTASEAIALLPELGYISDSLVVISERLDTMRAAIRKLLGQLDDLPSRVRVVRSLFNRTAWAVGRLDVGSLQQAALALEPATRIDLAALQNGTQSLLTFVQQGALQQVEKPSLPDKAQPTSSFSTGRKPPPSQTRHSPPPPFLQVEKPPPSQTRHSPPPPFLQVENFPLPDKAAFPLVFYRH